MKFFTNKETSKKIIIAILLIMSFNFISPTVSQADFGGALFEPIAQLLLGISDLVIAGLQGYFMGSAQIEYGGIDEIETNQYYIKYSPGIIFSGKVAGLKVNFIDAKYEDREQVTFIDGEWTEQEKCSYEDLSKHGFTQNNYTEQTSITDDEWYVLVPAKDHTILSWDYNEEHYTAVCTEAITGGDDYENNLWDWLLVGALVTVGYDIADYFEELKGTNWTVYKFEYADPINSYIESSAYILQDTVATWYKTLRAIALVGLLSVLVYVGIRILISSTGQEKAKYKKMIGDWLAAICILFILQYIMIFIIQISQKITDIFSVNIIGKNGEDVLMSNLRNEVEVAQDFSATFPQLLMYLVLVIHTVLFTVQYLKRLVYMAFFTLISPLVALTYPLDKIKDGQAQAFTTWLREYIFNALLQPMHLLLYYIFVSSAMSLVGSNPLYAVVAIGFLLPAEKFFRKMFGFDKASSASPLGAAAGGALIMNAINKMGQSSGKKAAGGAGGGSGSSDKSTPRYVSAPGANLGGGNPGGGNPGGGNPGGGNPGGGNPGGGNSGGSSSMWGQTIDSASYGSTSLKNGAKTLGGHYFNKGNLVKGAKGLGRTARKLGVGTVGAATLGTVGLAAGLATGDLGNALKYGAAGGAAGYMGANSVGDKLTEFEKNNREIFKEGALGTDEYNTRNSIKELTNDNDFNRVCKDLGVTNKSDKEALIRQFHSNGITSAQDIKKTINAGVSAGNRNQAQLIAAAKIRKQATQYGMKKKDIENQLSASGLQGKALTDAMNLIDML